MGGKRVSIQGYGLFLYLRGSSQIGAQKLTIILLHFLKYSLASTIIKHEFITLSTILKSPLSTHDSDFNLMLNCTLLEFNHIGLFGFEEEPNLLTVLSVCSLHRQRPFLCN